MRGLLLTTEQGKEGSRREEKVKEQEGEEICQTNVQVLLPIRP